MSLPTYLSTSSISFGHQLPRSCDFGTKACCVVTLFPKGGRRLTPDWKVAESLFLDDSGCMSPTFYSAHIIDRPSRRHGAG